MDIADIYREIAPKLQSYLVGGGLSHATSCDIVQETFLRLWKRRDELTDDLSQVSGLVFTIARNYRNDLARKAHREVLQEEITDADYAAAAEPSSRPSHRMDDAEQDDEMARRLKASLVRMPVQLLEAFTLVRLGNASVGEIARQIHASESNVKVRAHRAREMFRDLLNRDASADAAMVGQSVDAVTLEFAVLEAMMMLAAVDGEIAREEMTMFRELAESLRADDAKAFEMAWTVAVRGAAYIGLRAEMVSRERLVCEFVREAGDAFVAAAAKASRPCRERALSSLVALAKADGVYSDVERACIAALAKRLG